MTFEVWQHIENSLAATYYNSGPPPMLKAISRHSSQHGIRTEPIRTDA